MNTKLLAPCGINCMLCKGYLREKNTCPGCRFLDPKNSTFKSCTKCIIKNCPELAKTKSKFCYECEKYPCKRMKDLNKRYVTRYNYDTFKTLAMIRDKGIRKTCKQLSKKYSCLNGTICVHDGKCYKKASEASKVAKVSKGK